jgi:hypothetical protein
MPLGDCHDPYGTAQPIPGLDAGDLLPDAGEVPGERTEVHGYPK